MREEVEEGCGRRRVKKVGRVASAERDEGCKTKVERGQRGGVVFKGSGPESQVLSRSRKGTQGRGYGVRETGCGDNPVTSVSSDEKKAATRRTGLDGESSRTDRGRHIHTHTHTQTHSHSGGIDLGDGGGRFLALGGGGISLEGQLYGCFIFL